MVYLSPFSAMDVESFCYGQRTTDNGQRTCTIDNGDAAHGVAIKRVRVDLYSESFDVGTMRHDCNSERSRTIRVSGSIQCYLPPAHVHSKRIVIPGKKTCSTLLCR